MTHDKTVHGGLAPARLVDDVLGALRKGHVVDRAAPARQPVSKFSERVFQSRLQLFTLDQLACGFGLRNANAFSSVTNNLLSNSGESESIAKDAVLSAGMEHCRKLLRALRETGAGQ